MSEQVLPSASSYEHKLKIVLDLMLKNYKGELTPDQVELEKTVAKKMLKALGVRRGD